MKFIKPSHHIFISSYLHIFILFFTFSLLLFISNPKVIYALEDCGNNLGGLTTCKAECNQTPPAGYPTPIPGSHHCYPPSGGSSTSPAPAGTTTSTTGTPLGPIEGLGPLGTVIRFLSPNDVSPASDRLASVLSMVIGVITIVTGLWFTIRILIAGFTIISAGGDKNKMQESQHMITNSVIGLTVAVAAYALASLFSKILGINFLNITEALINLGK